MMKFLFSLAGLLAFAVADAQALYSDVKLAFGPDMVGYKHTVETDRTRPYDRSMDFSNALTFRPMPVSQWFPMTDNTDLGQVRVSDYTRVLKEEEEWETLPDEYFFSWFYYPETTVGKANLEFPTRAYKGGEVKRGKHPVIIYAPSYQASSAENFLLCEYLASQGYLVFAAPSRGVERRRMGKGTTAGAEAQLQDLNFLVGYASTLPYADLEQLYTIGFSFGGFPSVLLAMTNRYIDGVISLDGTFQYNPGVLAASGFYEMDRLQVPFVHFSQKEIPKAILEEQSIDPNLGQPFLFYDSLRQSPAYHFRSRSLTHGNFSTMGVLFQPRDLRQEPPESQIVASYADLCRRVAATLDIMNGYCSLEVRWDHPGYMASLDTSRMELLEHKTPETKHYSMRDFAATIRREGYEDLERIYQTTHRRYPYFELAEGDLNTIGLQLAFAETSREAGLRVFHFAISLFPESGNLHDSLAEAYLMAGRNSEAKHHFERSLELSPGNDNAKRRLMGL